MIVDTSALIAMLRDEPEAPFCAMAIENAAQRRISAANFLEAAVVIDGSRDPVASRRFDELIKEAGIVIEPVTEAQARLRTRSLSGFWQRQRSSRSIEFWRLLRLCSRQGYRRTIIV